MGGEGEDYAEDIIPINPLNIIGKRLVRNAKLRYGTIVIFNLLCYGG
jgi:hypothetical protein